ncbi:MAG TPA: hypothetical protein VNW46_07415 [Gemmatimonadaceae bacterium]|jgi:hypothetical protein|nr:hypothetical protein [Gemmatimonadaceae bacterium]
MLDELIASVSERTGLSAAKAHEAVDTIIAQLKAHLPAPVASHVDEMLAGNFTGTMAEAEQSLRQRFAAMSQKVQHDVADAAAKIKQDVGNTMHT